MCKQKADRVPRQLADQLPVDLEERVLRLMSRGHVYIKSLSELRGDEHTVQVISNASGYLVRI